MNTRERVLFVLLAPFVAIAGVLWGLACAAIVILPIIALLEILGFVR